MQTCDVAILDNAVVWPGDGREFAGHLIIRDGRIAEVNQGRYLGDSPTTDLHGLAISPGLVDVMLLGGFGETLRGPHPQKIIEGMASIGVTSVQFCCGVLSHPQNVQYADRIRDLMNHPAPDRARVLGWYPEGPFLDPNLTAAMPDFMLPPSRENIDRFVADMGDTFPMINISPGLEGDVAAIRQLVEQGKIVSMAHSNASADRTRACLDAGTSILGHFNCNNCGRFDDAGRRVPTIEDVALTDDRVQFIHLICDNEHTVETFVQLCVRSRGIEHICVVTDAQPQAGSADGPFRAEDGRTFVKKGSVARTLEGNLVGSTWLLPDQFRNFVRITGLPPREAIRAVTLNPATSLRLANSIGNLAPGAEADIVAWDKDLRICRVWRGGIELSNVSTLCECPLRTTSSIP